MADKDNLDQLFNLKASFPTKEETRAFFDAAAKNDIKALGKIIDQWPDAPKKWVTGNDPVIVEHFEKMDPKTIEYLTRRGADINAFDDSNFWSAMHLAAFHEKPEQVEKLLRCGADPDRSNSCKQTPLHYAAEKGDYASADLLVLCGADIEQGLKAAKKEEMRTVIRSAKDRREKFLASLNPSAPAPADTSDIPGPAPEPLPEPVPVASEQVIRIMKRIELKKAGHDPGPIETETVPAQNDNAPASKKPWFKRILNF